MAGTSPVHSVSKKKSKRATEERPWVRIPLIALALGFLALISCFTYHRDFYESF